MKQEELRPEVKGRIRRLQQAAARKRMLQDIPTQVYYYHPTHYAIALRYQGANQRAPILVAKGKDLIAAQIREIAEQHAIPFFQAPPLARALYYTTDIGKEIPTGLYIAVAKVLVYIHQLKQFEAGFGKTPVEIDNLPIPQELQYPERVEV